MKNTCHVCGKKYDDNLKMCPNCGSPNTTISKDIKKSHVSKAPKKNPKTIEELKQWYIDAHLPPENITRFFIGKNCKEKKAFGIYKDTNTDHFVVYKNKANGVRAIRYEGFDEAFAVNELYLRLKQEIANQKKLNSDKKKNNKNSKIERFIFRFRKIKNIFVNVILGFLFISIIVCLVENYIDEKRTPPRGYYVRDDDTYYYQYGDWYIYNNLTNDWNYYKEKDKNDLYDNYREYQDDSKTSNHTFENSPYYYEIDESSDNDSDYESSWDYDSGGSSWDSSGTDWNSDW